MSNLLKLDSQIRQVADLPGHFTLIREMGCTEKEFLYWMPGALGTETYVKSGSEISLKQAELFIRICFKTMEPRRIALVSIPRLRVSFHFETLEPQTIALFLKRFDSYTRRGGG